MGTGYDPSEMVAYGVVNGGVLPTFDKQWGLDGITRLSAGVYNVALTPGGIDESDSLDAGLPRFAVAPSSLSVTHIDDVTKQFRLTSLGVAADGDFSFSFRRLEI